MRREAICAEVIWDMDRRLPADDPLRTLTSMRVGEYAVHATPFAFTLATFNDFGEALSRSLTSASGHRGVW